MLRAMMSHSSEHAFLHAQVYIPHSEKTRPESKLQTRGRLVVKRIDTGAYI